MSSEVQILLGIFGLVGTLGGAVIVGWYGLRAQSQRQVAQVNTSKAEKVSDDSVSVLGLLRDCLAENAALRTENAKLRKPPRSRPRRAN